VAGLEEAAPPVLVRFFVLGAYIGADRHVFGRDVPRPREPFFPMDSRTVVGRLPRGGCLSDDLSLSTLPRAVFLQMGLELVQTKLCQLRISAMAIAPADVGLNYGRALTPLLAAA
jgi:hypothetical protein